MMNIKLKKLKAIDLDSKFKEYIIKNSDKNNVTDSLKEYFAQLSQNRDVMVKMEETKKTQEKMSEFIKITTSYINQMNLIRKKMTFGKEKYSCKMDFIWSDTIKSSSVKSHLIEFEICNAAFNLASLYYNTGLIISKTPSITKEIRKEALKNFKYALYIFNWIKEEAKKIPEKELPMDLHETYLDVCSTFCEINGQMEIYKIAKETSPKECVLHSKLMMTISDLYKKLAGLCTSLTMKKGIHEQITFFQNRALYYKAKVYLELKDEGKKKFDDKGIGYGEVVYFYNLALNELLECQKTIKKLDKIYIDKFENGIKKISEEKKEADDLNNRIYHEALPRAEEIKIESKNMMAPALPEELYIDENEAKAKDDETIFCKDLDLLAPKEVYDMLGRYKPQINELISKNLDQYENEGTISNFIQGLNIPKKLTAKPKKEGELGDDEENFARQLPQELWEKIEKIQEIGGINGLNKIMQGIIDKSNFLIGNLQNLLHSFEAEDNDDRMCRQRFRDKWIREPSLKLNFQMVEAAKSFIKSIQQTQVYDQQAYNEIEMDSQYLDRLMMPMAQLNKNIPAPEVKKVELNPEEKEVKEEIIKLYELSDKCTDIIKPIFSQINNDSTMIGALMDVLMNKSTEQAVYEKSKSEYEAKFEELRKISEEVKKQEEKISELVQKNSEKIMEKVDDYLENRIMDYFRNLDELSNMFMAKYEKIMKGDNYYKELKEKIDKLVKYGNDWMIKRSDEKNALLKSFGNMYKSQVYGSGTGYQ